MDILVLEYNAQFLHFLVTDKNTQKQFHHTLVYAFNGDKDREDLWSGLRRIVTQEHYTWSNKQLPETRVYSRLDRMFLNHEWSLQLSEYYANFLPERLFDHTPCLVTTTANNQSHNRPFKYYNMWSKAPDFKECVINCWTQRIRGTHMYGVVRKLKLLKPCLKQLNRTHFSAVENQSDMAQIKLNHIQKLLVQSPGDEDLVKHEYEAHKQFLFLYEAKMKFLKQKAKAHWLTEGDSNSSYFHGLIKARRKTNSIYQIKDHQDKLHTDEVGIQMAFRKYYQMLLGSKNQILKVKNQWFKKVRLALVLPDILTQNQGGFIQGRSIMENILIFQDIIRMYEKQVVSPRCMIKMDLQKAYDTIEWKFLDQMMQALKFPNIFRGWIM
ncbi:uncharacterized protein LOC141655213 [Silene latifolia]|uniref:uncharacterized protein LOC141655213 n=1 Tax=Silene latifolia TaxID=37657 RepID=UPI003D77EFB7